MFTEDNLKVSDYNKRGSDGLSQTPFKNGNKDSKKKYLPQAPLPFDHEQLYSDNRSSKSSVKINTHQRVS